MSSKKQPSEGTIQSVQRAAAILKCFTKTYAEMSVTTLSEDLGLHKSTVSRLLSTLQQDGFVEQNPETGKYHLGLTLVTLAGIVLDRIDLPKMAQPYLNELAEQTQETVNIVVLNGNECMNIGGTASPHPIQYIGRIGRRTPLHGTAAGKVLLAHLPSNEQQAILAASLSTFTANTMVEPEVLQQALQQVQQQGYAVVHEEYEEGLSAIAAPICDHSGRVVAAVAVSGPTYRLGLNNIKSFVEPVRETARLISAQLGCGSAD